MKKIIKDYAEACGFSFEEIVGRSMNRDLSIARQIICLKLRQIGHSFPEIGRQMNRNHNVIIYSVNRINGFIETREKTTILYMEKISQMGD